MENKLKKQNLFDKLKKKGIFWSYSKDMPYNEDILIEYTLKYADFDDIVLLFKLFEHNKIKKIWQNKMQDDQRFIRFNYMIARVFFGMNVEAEYFKRKKSARFEKLKQLAS